jgi:hypothetical protein
MERMIRYPVGKSAYRGVSFWRGEYGKGECMEVNHWRVAFAEGHLSGVLNFSSLSGI